MGRQVVSIPLKKYNYIGSREKDPSSVSSPRKLALSETFNLKPHEDRRHYMMKIQNPALRKQVHQRNLTRFRQIVSDLTDILQKVEVGELEDIWFIRRLTCAVLGATKMTDEEGHLRWICWKKGKLFFGPVVFERPAAFVKLQDQRLAGAPMVTPGFTVTALMSPWRDRNLGTM